MCYDILISLVPFLLSIPCTHFLYLSVPTPTHQLLLLLNTQITLLLPSFSLAHLLRHALVTLRETLITEAYLLAIRRFFLLYIIYIKYIMNFIYIMNIMNIIYIIYNIYIIYIIYNMYIMYII